MHELFALQTFWKENRKRFSTLMNFFEIQFMERSKNS